MGLLEIENAIIPVTGEFTAKRMRIETHSCKHCQRVIPVIHEGCTVTAESHYSCRRCNGLVCLRCAETMHKNGGKCSSFVARLEHCIKTGASLTDYFEWERKAF